ncbi:MAG TPA: PP2C family protein-serine/threonine phosphatase, partial [Leptospiraceae bacterium]|nr:PP2C family protein-serine/threonine phosphatase [Leptospiraceae bacterium]
PVLLRKGESPSLLEAKGRIVGIFPEMSVEARCIDYQAGDRFVFYTDGLVEARKNSGEMLGDESVIAYMDSLRNLPPDEFCDRLIGYVRESTSNCAQDDDVTLFVIDVV